MAVVENVQYNLNGMGAFSVSESGVLAFVTGELGVETTRLKLTDRSGTSVPGCDQSARSGLVFTGR